MKTLEKIAEKNNLEIIDLTNGRNGYPSNTFYGIDATGFNSFDEVKEFAKKNDLEVINIHRKDGWHFWESNGTAYKPYEVSSEVYGDNYSEIGKIDEAEFIENEVKFFFENDLESFEQIESFLTTKKEIWKQIEIMEDDEIVITHEGNYYETVKKITLAFSEDTHNWGIALIKM